MSVQLEVTTENLLKAVVRMPKGEFNRFVEKARELRRNGESKKSVSPAEVDILHKINTIFDPKKRQRYNELYARFQNDDLETREYDELTQLSDEFEMLNAKRLEYIIKLADLRNQPFDQVMELFEMKNSGNE